MTISVDDLPEHLTTEGYENLIGFGTKATARLLVKSFRTLPEGPSGGGGPQVFLRFELEIDEGAAQDILQRLGILKRE